VISTVQLTPEKDVNAFLLNEHILSTTKVVKSHAILRQIRDSVGVAIGFSTKTSHRLHTQELAQLKEHIIATLSYRNISITMARIYIRLGHAKPQTSFAYISNNLRNYIIKADLTYTVNRTKKRTNSSTPYSHKPHTPYYIFENPAGQNQTPIQT